MAFLLEYTDIPLVYFGGGCHAGARLPQHGKGGWEPKVHQASRGAVWWFQTEPMRQMEVWRLLAKVLTCCDTLWNSEAV
jgi:hypothetical protein